MQLFGGVFLSWGLEGEAIGRGGNRYAGRAM